MNSEVHTIHMLEPFSENRVELSSRQLEATDEVHSDEDLWLVSQAHHWRVDYVIMFIQELLMLVAIIQ
jgi:hypothetical protein